MITGQFSLPIWYDLIATFAFAITGAAVGLRKHYDLVGVIALAIAVGVGGGIMRDGIFLQQVPAAVTDWRYMATIIVAVVTAVGISHLHEHRKYILVIDLLDALGLAAYTIVGTQKSIFAGIAIVGAIFIGVINAVGGGVLRDVLANEKPEIFKPSQLYAVISVLGAILFVIMCGFMKIHAEIAAISTIAIMLLARTQAIMFDLRTSSAKEVKDKIKASLKKG